VICTVCVRTIFPTTLADGVNISKVCVAPHRTRPTVASEHGRKGVSDRLGLYSYLKASTGFRRIAWPPTVVTATTITNALLATKVQAPTSTR